MSDSIKRYLMQACLQFLKPIARLLIRGGVTHKEFSELSKAAYVEVARNDYGVQGRKTNMARVAILTGLSRKECLRVRRLIEERGEDVPLKPNRAARVVTAWVSDPDFLDKNGDPKVLPLGGEGATIDELFRRYAGDLPRGALMKELERVNAIEQTAIGLRLVRRTFIPKGFDQEKIRILATQLSDLGGTIYHNLLGDGGPRMQRYVVNDMPLSPAAIKGFQALATQKGQEMLEQLDINLTEAGNQPTTKGTDHTRVGVGVYFFEEPTKGANT